jgi:hypothetical protein
LFSGPFSKNIRQAVSWLFRGEFVRRWLRQRSPARAAQERVLIVGGGETGRFAAWLLGGGGSRSASGQFHLAGFVDDDLFKQGRRIGDLQVLGGREDIQPLVEALDIGILIFAIHNISQEERQRLLGVCALTPARLVQMPDILGAIQRASPPDASPAGVRELLDEVDSPLDAGWQSAAAAEMSAQLRAAQDAVQPGSLPLTSQAIDAWLVSLAETASSGDLQALQAQIKALRSRISSGA